MAHDEKKNDDLVAVVVNGNTTMVTVHGNPTLMEIVDTALQQTQNTGQPVENWELRGPDDAPITDLKIHFKKLDLQPGDMLYLNLRAGVGG